MSDFVSQELPVYGVSGLYQTCPIPRASTNHPLSVIQDMAAVYQPTYYHHKLGMPADRIWAPVHVLRGRSDRVWPDQTPYLAHWGSGHSRAWTEVPSDGTGSQVHMLHRQGLLNPGSDLLDTNYIGIKQDVSVDQEPGNGDLSLCSCLITILSRLVIQTYTIKSRYSMSSIHNVLMFFCEVSGNLSFCGNCMHQNTIINVLVLVG